MVGKLCVSCAFTSVYIMTAELLPTTMRNAGLGCCVSVSRIGSAAGAYIADLVSCVALPYIIADLVSCVALSYIIADLVSCVA